MRKNALKKAFVVFVVVALVAPMFPDIAFATTTTIRQEINILDSVLSAAGGSYATSSEIVNLDSSKYTGATYYFEIVAHTSVSLESTVTLRNATSSAILSTITIPALTTNYTRLPVARASFTAPGMATDLVVVVGNEVGATKEVQAARIIIVQSADPISATQTQIEIGSATTSASNTTTLPLQNPKYWLYDSSKWDGSPTVYAEVTYKTNPVASSTIFAASATTTTTHINHIGSIGAGYVVVEAWGGGGGGDGATSAATVGGGGGGGGAYARSTTTVAVGSVNIVGIGRGGAEGIGSGATAAASSTFWGANGTIIQAEPGGGSTGAAGGATTTLAATVGDVQFAGGGGGSGQTTADTGGGGGGAAGPNGAGAQGGAAAASGPGGSGGQGNASLGGAGGAGGNGGDDTCNAENGGMGVNNVLGAGGGGGADGDVSSLCVAGNGGRPGGGGGGSDEGVAEHLGGPGQIKITEWIGTVGVALEKDDGNFGTWTFVSQIITSGKVATTSARARSASFVPENNLHYRIVASTTNATASYNIYNAKIVVDQTSPTLLETQYLLLNQADSGSTGLQNYMTLYDANDWSNVDNTYKVSHDATNASDASKLVDITAAPDTDLTNGNVSGANQQIGASEITDLVDDHEIDVNVTNTTGVVGASRILVQVAPIPSVAPTVTTNFANAGFSTAILNGTKTAGDDATEHGFAYSTDATLNTSVTTTTIGALTSNSSFLSNIGGLTQSQTYYFRAYATNGGGTGYGVVLSFFTGNSTATRMLRLFEGFKIKLNNGKLQLHQR